MADNKQLPLFELDTSELKAQKTLTQSKPESDSPYSKHIEKVPDLFISCSSDTV